MAYNVTARRGESRYTKDSDKYNSDTSSGSSNPNVKNVEYDTGDTYEYSKYSGGQKVTIVRNTSTGEEYVKDTSGSSSGGRTVTQNGIIYEVKDGNYNRVGFTEAEAARRDRISRGTATGSDLIRGEVNLLNAREFNRLSQEATRSYNADVRKENERRRQEAIKNANFSSEDGRLLKVTYNENKPLMSVYEPPKKQAAEMPEEKQTFIDRRIANVNRRQNEMAKEFDERLTLQGADFLRSGKNDGWFKSFGKGVGRTGFVVVNDASEIIRGGLFLASDYNKDVYKNRRPYSFIGAGITNAADKAVLGSQAATYNAYSFLRGKVDKDFKGKQYDLGGFYGQGAKDLGRAYDPRTGEGAANLVIALSTAAAGSYLSVKGAGVPKTQTVKATASKTKINGVTAKTQGGVKVVTGRQVAAKQARADFIKKITFQGNKKGAVFRGGRRVSPKSKTQLSKQARNQYYNPKEIKTPTQQGIKIGKANKGRLTQQVATSKSGKVQQTTTTLTNKQRAGIGYKVTETRTQTNIFNIKEAAGKSKTKLKTQTFKLKTNKGNKPVFDGVKEVGGLKRGFSYKMGTRKVIKTTTKTKIKPDSSSKVTYKKELQIGRGETETIGGKGYSRPASQVKTNTKINTQDSFLIATKKQKLQILSNKGSKRTATKKPEPILKPAGGKGTQQVKAVPQMKGNPNLYSSKTSQTVDPRLARLEATKARLRAKWELKQAAKIKKSSSQTNKAPIPEKIKPSKTPKFEEKKVFISKEAAKKKFQTRAEETRTAPRVPTQRIDVNRARLEAARRLYIKDTKARANFREYYRETGQRGIFDDVLFNYPSTRGTSQPRFNTQQTPASSNSFNYGLSETAKGSQSLAARPPLVVFEKGTQTGKASAIFSLNAQIPKATTINDNISVTEEKPTLNIITRQEIEPKLKVNVKAKTLTREAQQEKQGFNFKPVVDTSSSNTIRERKPPEEPQPRSPQERITRETPRPRRITPNFPLTPRRPQRDEELKRRLLLAPRLKLSNSDDPERRGFFVLTRSKGIFSRASQDVFSESDALAFGSSRVRNTLRASFKLEPTTQSPTTSFKGSAKLKDFYKKGSIFIEKREKRLNTRGEKTEIKLKRRGLFGTKRRGLLR